MQADAATLQPDLRCNQPDVVFDELIGELREAIANHPRALQRAIGPSGVGEECPRALIAALFGLPAPPEPPNLRSWVGTQIHNGMEAVIGSSWLQTAGDGPRYLLEQRVPVGTIGGQPLVGSVDCFDILTGTVVDWKSKSRTRMRQHRLHGPGQIYRVQAHCYGLGMVNAGHHVNQVMFVFIPRDGEFADIFHWAEPFNPQIALDAITRANELHALGALLGPQQAMDAFRHCDGEFCRHCNNYRPPYGGAARAAATTTAELFGTKQRSTTS